MDTKNKALLASLFLFDSLDFFTLDSGESISSCCPVKHYSSGEKIMLHDNADEKYIGLVSAGKVRLTTGFKSKEVLLKYAGVGEAFGAASLFGSFAYPTECIADCDCELILIPLSLVTRLIGENTVISLNYLRFLSSKISFLNREIAVFTAGSAEDKLAVYLYSLGSSEDTVTVGSMTSLASQLGISRASLYRAVENLVSVGAVKYDGKAFTIIDRQKLTGV